MCTFHDHYLTSLKVTIKTMASERFLADRAAPLCSLKVAKSFGQLRSVARPYSLSIYILTPKLLWPTTPSVKEQKYAHYFSQASWAGARIIQGQWTSQAERLYDLLICTFSDSGHLGDLEGLKQKANLSPEEWEDLLQYTCQVRARSNFHHHNTHLPS